MTKRWVRQIDWALLGTTTVLLLFGFFVLYSATQGWAPSYFRRQVIWFLLSLPVAVLLAWLDPYLWARRARWLYLLNLLLLVLVALLGEERKGAQRWLALPGGYQVQPSEFAKLCLVLTLAAMLSRMGDEIRTPRGFFLALLHAGLPILLVFRQPDLGTSLVLGTIWLGMLYLAGAKRVYLALTVLIAFLGFVGMWHWNILKPYQKARLVSFIHPEADPQETGYHILQARFAIGSGQVLGKGYLKGTQKQLRYIPEQHTDFIFAVVGEEGGFVGSTLLLGLYALLLTRIWRIMVATGHLFYRYVAGGILLMFGFHIVTNLGMSLGLFPVVGIPLPFLSYGGTMLLVSVASVGLLIGLQRWETGLQF